MLRKCQGKVDCLICLVHEMFINEMKTNLNTQTDYLTESLFNIMF